MALPPRKEARQRGRSVFVADDLKPYPDQWVYLATPRRLSVAGPQTLIPSATGGAHPLDLAFIDEEEELPSSLTRSPRLIASMWSPSAGCTGSRAARPVSA